MSHLLLDSVEEVLLLAEGLTPEDLAAAERGEGQAAPASPPPVQAPATNTVTPAASVAPDSFRSGELTTSGFNGWPEEGRQEFKTNEYNGRIGTDLVFENDSVRVWHITLEPGEKMPVHRHALTYFYDVGSGEFALHNLENVGDTTMIFCAVELKKEGENAPLPLATASS